MAAEGQRRVILPVDRGARQHQKVMQLLAAVQPAVASPELLDERFGNPPLTLDLVLVAANRRAKIRDGRDRSLAVLESRRGALGRDVLHS